VCSGSVQAWSGRAHPRLRLKKQRCLRPDTKTELAKEKINPESRGIRIFFDA
jgi:hypothetical protein